jgi:hypothetical protein
MNMLIRATIGDKVGYTIYREEDGEGERRWVEFDVAAHKSTDDLTPQGLQGLLADIVRSYARANHPLWMGQTMRIEYCGLVANGVWRGDHLEPLPDSYTPG